MRGLWGQSCGVSEALSAGQALHPSNERSQLQGVPSYFSAFLCVLAFPSAAWSAALWGVCLLLPTLIFLWVSPIAKEEQK